LEEAAALDGLNRWETFLSIVLPLAKPALAAQAIFIFMGAWNNFLMPLIILSDPEMFSLPLGLNTFKGQYISYWNYIMAASMVLTLPALVIYAFLIAILSKELPLQEVKSRDKSVGMIKYYF
jgi:multiple sugar transport system permease protein